MSTPLARSLFAAATALSLLGPLPEVLAQSTELYDWPDQTAPILITTPKSLIFVHKDGKPFRTFSYTPLKSDPLAITDIDKDGAPEIVAMGKPTFAIDTDGDPIWAQSKGCKMALVADFAADERLDVFCADGRTATLYSHDNQLIWKANLGRRFSDCGAGDLTADLKADIECAMGKRFVRVDGAGTVITTEGEESALPADPKLFGALEPAGTSLLSQGETFDVDNDGTKEESLLMDGTLLVVKSKSKPAAPLAMVDLGTAEPRGLVVKDLDGKPGLEVVALTDTAAFILWPADKRSDTFALAARLTNTPMAELQTVYANNFPDDKAAAAEVTKLQDKLSACYGSQVKKSQFAGSGRLIIALDVDDKGKITSAKKVHSELPDKKVVECAIKTLEKGTYPVAKEGETGTLNVTMFMTFRAQ